MQTKINLSNINRFKEELKKQHSLKEIDNLRIDMEGTIEQMKLFAPLIPILTLATSIFGLFFTTIRDSRKDYENRLDLAEEELNKTYCCSKLFH